MGSVPVIERGDLSSWAVNNVPEREAAFWNPSYVSRDKPVSSIFTVHDKPDRRRTPQSIPSLKTKSPWTAHWTPSLCLPPPPDVSSSPFPYDDRRTNRLRSDRPLLQPACARWGRAVSRASLGCHGTLLWVRACVPPAPGLGSARSVGARTCRDAAGRPTPWSRSRRSSCCANYTYTRSGVSWPSRARQAAMLFGSCSCLAPPKRESFQSGRLFCAAEEAL